MILMVSYKSEIVQKSKYLFGNHQMDQLQQEFIYVGRDLSSWSTEIVLLEVDCLAAFEVNTSLDIFSKQRS